MRADPLFPADALLPLTGSAGVVPTEASPGSLRPLSAQLGVAPVWVSKHHTPTSRVRKKQETEYNEDNKVVKDSVDTIEQDS